MGPTSIAKILLLLILTSLLVGVGVFLLLVQQTTQNVPAMALVLRAPSVPVAAVVEPGSIDGSVFTYKGSKLECKVSTATSAPEVLLVMQHGLTRNMASYFSMAENAARKSSRPVMAGAIRFAFQNEAIPGGLYWADNGWIQGKYAAGTSLSSYEMLDGFVHTLYDKYKSSLKKVVVAGHSAGGQVLCRYIAYGESLPPTVETFYVVMGPSTYMWLSANRPKGCTGHNQFFYGLDRLPDYMSAKGTADQLRDKFMSRNVCLSCNRSDTGSAMLDTSPGAMCQGANRFERFQNYTEHLKTEMNHPKLQSEEGDGNGHSPNMNGPMMKKLLS